MKNDELKRLEHKLRKLRESGFNIAVAQVLNEAAFETRRGYQSNIRSDLTNRNNFTANSVRVEKASRNALEARTGSIATYMARTEEGGTTAITGGYRPITTNYAAGQGRSTGERKRQPIEKFKIFGMTIARDAVRAYRRLPSRKARNAATVRDMARRGGGVVYMRTAKGRGLFDIGGTAKNPTVNMVYSLRHKTVTTPPHNLLRGATDTARRGMAEGYRKALLRQLDWGL